MTRFSVTLSDDLTKAIERTAAEAEISKNEVLRKALQLYLAAREGQSRGLKIGLAQPETNKLETEIIGL